MKKNLENEKNMTLIGERNVDHHVGNRKATNFMQ